MLKTRVIRLMFLAWAGILLAGSPAGSAQDLSGKLAPDMAWLGQFSPSGGESAWVTAVLQTGTTLTDQDRLDLRNVGGVILYEFPSANMYALRVSSSGIRRLGGQSDLLQHPLHQRQP